jgi:hypothetical protein
MKLEETPLFLYRPSGELDAHGESCAALVSEGIQIKTLANLRGTYE